MSSSSSRRPIILASASPRRHELLEQAGVPFSIKVSGCDETPVLGETARQMVERLALVKAKVVATEHPGSLVIGADTTVCIDNQSLGKPESPQDACVMLRKIQGRTHEVWGGIAVLCIETGLSACWSHKTFVTMRPMADAAIQQYVSTGEPLDKAGSYAIQGIGLQYVDTIEGSYSNVVGLNIAALVEKLRDVGAL